VKLHGIFAPLTTPYAADGSVSLAHLRNNIARYNQTGLAGYAMNGSTGESVLQLWDDIYRMWETAREVAAPSKILIAGTGAESTSETIEHTNRAASLGYPVALVRTPSFYKPAMSESALAEHYLRVADAAKIPILVYSVPVFTHITVEAPLVARVSKHANIVGMKDSSGSVQGIADIIARAPKEFQTLAGSASTLYESLEKGAAGAILALACAFPDLCVEIYKAARAGDKAKAHSLAQKLIAPAKMFGPQYGIAGLKYALDRLGYHGGASRGPLWPVDTSAQAEIDTMLSNLMTQTAHQL
jgi:4-hydroxy-2-oxoglutarate aldolase